MVEKKPYVLAVWDWGTGVLRLWMIARDRAGEILPLERRTNDVHQAYRWASHQAARQYLRRKQQENRWEKRWRVVDLRRVHAPWGW